MYDKTAPHTIQNLFSTIAKDYDLANCVLSFGLFRLWNQRLIKATTADHLLDLCAGTGDIALGGMKQKRYRKATLIDFCSEMLSIAKEKAKKQSIDLDYVCADVQTLPFKENAFDAATMAYGIRNVKEPEKCLREVYRVLKPGATLGILELTRPTTAFLRAGHRLYLKTCVPLLGRLVATNGDAYKYLSSSIKGFISPKELIALLLKSGFHEPTITPLTGGIATLMTCQKSCE